MLAISLLLLQASIYSFAFFVPPKLCCSKLSELRSFRHYRTLQACNRASRNPLSLVRLKSEDEISPTSNEELKRELEVFDIAESFFKHSLIFLNLLYRTSLKIRRGGTLTYFHVHFERLHGRSSAQTACGDPSSWLGASLQAGRSQIFKTPQAMLPLPPYAA